MWNEPAEKYLKSLPSINVAAAEDRMDRVLHLRFFIDTLSWYVAGFDEATRTFFGCVVDEGSHSSYLWRNFHYDALRSMRLYGCVEVDRDLGWVPRRAEEFGPLHRARDVVVSERRR